MCSPDTHPAPCTATPIGPIVSTSYASDQRRTTRSEEHTSELQSRLHLVCRLLLETKKPDISEYSPAMSPTFSSTWAHRPNSLLCSVNPGSHTGRLLATDMPDFMSAAPSH